jgi:hypothetical protein
LSGHCDPQQMMNILGRYRMVYELDMILVSVLFVFRR